MRTATLFEGGREVVETRVLLVFFRQDGLVSLHRPVDAEAFVVPEHAEIMRGRVGGVDLVLNFRVFGQRAVTMRESDGNIELSPVRIREFDGDMLPVCRRRTAQ